MTFGPSSDRVRVRRHGERGRYDPTTVHAILDEGFVCHLAFVAEGRPAVIPTIYGRDGDRLYVHGSVASRVMRHATLDVCVAVTHVDGLVFARSAFHHSVNYRSVVVVGEAQRVTGDALEPALRVITEHAAPGRWAHCRPPSRKELAATGVLALDLNEASAKIRGHGAVDDEADLDLPYWAGVLPLSVVAGEPQPNPDVTVPVPDHVAAWARPSQAIGT